MSSETACLVVPLAAATAIGSAIVCVRLAETRQVSAGLACAVGVLMGPLAVLAMIAAPLRDRRAPRDAVVSGAEAEAMLQRARAMLIEREVVAQLAEAEELVGDARAIARKVLEVGAEAEQCRAMGVSGP